MATGCGLKRALENATNSECSKKARTVKKKPYSLNDFVKWCDEASRDGMMKINEKVTLSRELSCAQYGMIAMQDIDAEEVLFEVHRSILITPSTSDIRELLQIEKSSIESPSGWVSLLLALMYEYTNPESRWAPYIQLVPDFDELLLPMFWDREELKRELQGTGIIEAVDKDIENISTEYETIALPFIQKHSDVFPKECQDVMLYKQMVAFVMAYSFNEGEKKTDQDGHEEENTTKSPPMMVPMADMLNHVAKNNAQLYFGDVPKMVAVRPIKKGEEIFNTYGELPNSQLLHMYGFAEAHPNNHFDSVEIPVNTVYDAVKKNTSEADLDLLKEKWGFLKNLDIVEEDDVFIIDHNGCVTEEELYQTLKVLSMSAEEFKQHREQDSSDDEDFIECLGNDDIQELPASWKKMLSLICKECIARYSSTLAEEEAKLKPDVLDTYSNKQKYCVFVRHGQLKLLHNMLNLCDNKELAPS